MKSVFEHYEKHLGPIYGWMLGGIDPASATIAAELDRLELPPAAGKIAVDLGAGPGAHALPLARRGYRVTAIDSCALLLEALASSAGELPIRTALGDLRDFRSLVPGPIDVLLCMGDTLTHLEDVSSVGALLDSAAQALAPGGVFAATFRDYSTPLEGDARFIAVRSDEQQILTCFLEYEAARVIVHDLLQRRQGARWGLEVSSYPKLRLRPSWVEDRLRAQGLEVRRDAASGGMVRVVARRR
jgi:SAM-dependent methyltransferase